MKNSTFKDDIFSLQHEHCWFLFVLIIGVCLWLHRLGIFDFYPLDASEIIFSRESAGTVLFRTRWSDQAPFYFFLLHCWGKLFGEGLLLTRLLNVAINICNTFLIYKLSMLFYQSKRVSIGSCFLFVLSPFSIFLVRDGRMYALLICLSLSAVYFLTCYIKGRGGRNIFLFAVFIALSMCTHFETFFLMGLLGVYSFSYTLLYRRNIKKTAMTVLGFILSLLFAAHQVYRGGIFLLNQDSRTEWCLSNHLSKYLLAIADHSFVNSSWDFYLNNSCFRPLYFGLITVFVVWGIVKAPVLARLFSAVWILLSLAIVFVLLNVSLTLDARPRYFCFMVPVAYMAMANGMFGSNREGPKNVRAIIKQAVMVLVFLLISLISVKITTNKWHESSPGWSVVMKKLDAIYSHNMSLYYSPGFEIYAPIMAVDLNKLHPNLRSIRSVENSKNKFSKDLDAGKEIVLLNSNDARFNWHRDELEQYQYQLKDRLGYAGAVADVYVKNGKSMKKGTINYQKINQKIKQLMVDAKGVLGGNINLKNAFVALVSYEGDILKAGEYMPDENGRDHWRLGVDPWEYVGYVNAESQGVLQEMIWAHPKSDTVLLISFPLVNMADKIILKYGIADSGIRNAKGAPVKCSFFLGDQVLAKVLCENNPGWNELTFHPSSDNLSQENLNILIETDDDTARHFCFNIGFANENLINEELQLLSDKIMSFKVYRAHKKYSTKNDCVFSIARIHKEELHDSGSDEDCWADNRWVWGGKVWQMVARARLSSGGEPRTGVWMHPIKDSTIIAELVPIKLGKSINGFYGISDHAVEMAKQRNITAPIKFQILINDSVLFEKEVPRQSGWQEFSIPIGDKQALKSEGNKLTMRVSTKDDSWAHFMFDLQSD